MNRKLTHPLIGLTITMAVVAGGSSTTVAFADTPKTAGGGEVLALQNTPHLYVGDEAGTVHLAADVPALSGHAVAWSTRSDVSVGELRQYTLGTPWLSMMLVRIGTAIYLPQTQPDGARPELRLVGSIDDLALIGVNAENYGRIVLDQPAWEARYGLRVNDLRFDDLSLDGQSRVGPPAPEVVVASSESTSPDDAALVAQLVPPGRVEESAPPVGGPPAGTTEERTAEGLARN
jgi:hypothetical protein